MKQHHQEAIDIFLSRYTPHSWVTGILLCGSIAHGFEKPDSDIDVVIIADAAEFKKRKQDNTLAFSIWDICRYEHGYVDCKVVDRDMLELIAQKGSDAARYAFQGSRILYSTLPGLEDLLRRIDRYPAEQKEERKKRFASQILAWKWYYSEGVKKGNAYLLYLAVQKLILFSARLVLNENEMLFPYHKWILRVLETAPRKPEGLMKAIDTILLDHSPERVNSFCADLLSFVSFTEKSVDWPNYFLKDSEQNWIEHEPPVDDL
ncbi:MAG: nucleotidyltransferase domain-containing protein [Spirochaetales bacterium]|nr:nucleotidyltransferase domain-containing protein [Spirochaetales bacterium]